MIFTMEWWLALFGVAVLGIQTSISPCPLTTNIAAISYISRKVSRSRDVICSGVLYTLGRTFVYVLLAVLILSAVFSGGESTTRFFQSKIHAYLGPILIYLGLMLMGLLSFQIGSVQGEKMQMFVDRMGMGSAFPLGAIFALAFCPTSAATFLATITISSQYQSTILFPMVFGIATAIPVLLFAVIIAVNVQMIGKMFSTIHKIDWWSRNITGCIFLAVGVWFSLRYVYGAL